MNSLEALQYVFFLTLSAHAQWGYFKTERISALDGFPNVTSFGVCKSIHIHEVWFQKAWRMQSPVRKYWLMPLTPQDAKLLIPSKVLSPPEAEVAREEPAAGPPQQYQPQWQMGGGGRGSPLTSILGHQEQVTIINLHITCTLLSSQTV